MRDETYGKRTSVSERYSRNWVPEERVGGVVKVEGKGADGKGEGWWNWREGRTLYSWKTRLNGGAMVAMVGEGAGTKGSWSAGVAKR